jgi:hypothetical protein
MPTNRCTAALYTPTTHIPRIGPRETVNHRRNAQPAVFIGARGAAPPMGCRAALDRQSAPNGVPHQIGRIRASRGHSVSFRARTGRTRKGRGPSAAPGRRVLFGGRRPRPRLDGQPDAVHLAVRHATGYGWRCPKPAITHGASPPMHAPAPSARHLSELTEHFARHHKSSGQQFSPLLSTRRNFTPRSAKERIVA